MPPKYVNGQVGYIEIPAIDIQRSADFYVKVFGWRITKRADGSSAFEDTTGALRGTWVVGRQRPNPACSSSCWSTTWPRPSMPSFRKEATSFDRSARRPLRSVASTIPPATSSGCFRLLTPEQEM